MELVSGICVALKDGLVFVVPVAICVSQIYISLSLVLYWSTWFMYFYLVSTGVYRFVYFKMPVWEMREILRHSS